jgi:hypothetical protein
MTLLVIILLLTVLIEAGVAHLFFPSANRKQQTLAVVGINLITTPLANIAILLLSYTAVPSFMGYALVAATVFTAEAYVYYAILGKSPKVSMVMSFVLNCLSLVLGTIGGFFLLMLITALISVISPHQPFNYTQLP